MTTTDTRTPLPDEWEAKRAKGRAWAWQVRPGGEPSIIDTLASLPQINSLRVADEIVRELAGRGLEIREAGR